MVGYPHNADYLPSPQSPEMPLHFAVGVPLQVSDMGQRNQEQKADTGSTKDPRLEQGAGSCQKVGRGGGTHEGETSGDS